MTTTTETIQVRQDTSSNWSTNNPVPKAGEWCFETDTGVTKIGDGATNYNSLAAVGKTDATKAELDKLHNLSTTKTELGYVHGVTSAIQTQIDAKFAKADIQTSFGETLSDEKVASEKLVKNSLDAKQDGITVANNSMLKASVLSAMNIVGENNSGRRYDEPKTLAKMISAAHSTYCGDQAYNLTDTKKFIKVGSPIFNNGMVSGCGESNYYGIKQSILNTIGNKKWKLKWSGKLPQSGSEQYVFGIQYNDANKRAGINIGRFNAGDNFFFNVLLDDNGTPTYSTNAYLSLANSTEPNYDGYVEFTGTKYILGIKLEGQTSFTTTEIESTNPIAAGTSDNLLIGYKMTTGAINLQTIELIVDGIPVFSGNKTGIDTIKPDDYTVVGTPTISADGVASGFGSSNYLTLPYSYSDNVVNYAEKIKFTTGSDIATRQAIRGIASNVNKGIGITIQNGELNYRIGTGTGWEQAKTNNISANTTYTVEFTQTNTTSTFKLYSENDTLLDTKTVTYTGLLYSQIVLGRNLIWNDSIFLGSIDLNAFKIYVDGNLVYQPCLKIPYTLAANDKKFISPIYEGRAKDMADQFGVAPYHILDETNNNFAFPYGSVEEKVAPKIVVGHYEDGASAWEQYLDRTMIQRGTMVADTDVTFPCSDEYANTNYTLSCPFSAKTTSGFTPSASGTYIAVGKF